MMLKLVSGVGLSFALAVGMVVRSAPPANPPVESEALIGCCTGDGLPCLNTPQCVAREAGVCGAPCN